MDISSSLSCLKDELVPKVPSKPGHVICTHDVVISIWSSRSLPVKSWNKPWHLTTFGLFKFKTLQSSHNLLSWQQQKRFVQTFHSVLYDSVSAVGLAELNGVRCDISKAQRDPLWWIYDAEGVCLLSHDQCTASEGVIHPLSRPCVWFVSSLSPTLSVSGYFSGPGCDAIDPVDCTSTRQAY